MRIQYLAITIAAVVIVAATILYGLVFDDTSTTQSVPLGDHVVIPQEVADANNSFAVDFYKIASADDSGNIFFSPTSMYVAFGALYEGAMEKTASQMTGVFGFEPDTQVRHNMMSKTLASINRDDPHTTLDMANSLWVAELYDVYESYIDTLRDVYFAHTENLNYIDNVGSAKIINQWISDNTNDKITKAVDPGDFSPLTLATIVNAVYFKGTWTTQFPEEHTKAMDFWTGSEVTSADFMGFETPMVFNYAHSDGAQVLQLPYKGDRLSMIVILPDDRDNIKDFEESLSTEMIRKWQGDLKETEVEVLIPKFEMKIRYGLVKPLTDMGMGDVFDSYLANLRGMADVSKLPGNIYVSNAIHEAYVKVNEEGSEAAAVTVIIVTTESESPPIPRFVADHPFTFIIQDDESGTILFMGKISDPTFK